jgi:hypothetical protein
MANLTFIELEALSGPPPVLRTEDRKLYDQIRAQFMSCFKPKNILEWQLINRLVEEAWFIKRCSRHQTLAIERWYQQSLEFSGATAESPEYKKGAVGKEHGRQNDAKAGRGGGFAAS